MALPREVHFTASLFLGEIRYRIALWGEKSSRCLRVCRGHSHFPERYFWPVTGTFPSTPLHVQVTAAKRGEDNFRIADITGQSLPVFMASRMMDVLWSDLHMTHQSRSSKSGDSFYRPFRTA
jgi:hypothetical protein